jgi:hypothetical protein
MLLDVPGSVVVGFMNRIVFGFVDPIHINMLLLSMAIDLGEVIFEMYCSNTYGSLNIFTLHIRLLFVSAIYKYCIASKNNPDGLFTFAITSTFVFSYILGALVFVGIVLLLARVVVMAAVVNVIDCAEFT